MAPSKKLILLVFLAAGLHTGRADSTDAAETRLRENARAAILQLRSVTVERDNLQAQNADLQSQVQNLTQQVAKLTRQEAADSAAAAKTIAELQARVAAQAKSIADYQKAQEAAESEQQRTTATLNTFQSRAAGLTADNVTLQRALDDARSRNAAMLKLSSEILGRYEKQGIGGVLLAKEPFVGIARTKLQNIAQDYQLKLLAQRVAP
jgi:chromosome segregation ATPase